MEEYIEKNQLKEKLRLLFKYESFPIADIEEIIDWLPVIPKRGRWRIETENNVMYCDSCGKVFDCAGLEEIWNYCPNCGAKMMNERG